MKKLMKKIWNKILIYIKPFLNWRFLISFSAAWMITNGWSYIFIVLGPILELKWMTTIGIGYQTFLWMPFTPEKLVTIPLAIWFHTLIFRNDEKTHHQLEKMYSEAKSDWQKIKNKFKRSK